MIDLAQLRDCVVAPAHRRIGAYSIAGMRLVIGTGLVESGYRFLKQNGGPAMGPWEEEPATHNYLRSWLSARPILNNLVEQLLVPNFDSLEQLTWNWQYAAAMCRIKYLQSPLPLPHEDDLEGMGAFYKQVYNTAAGKGSSAIFITLATQAGIMNL